MDISPLTSVDFETFQKSEQLDAKTDDPETTPYASKYESRKLLESLEFKLNLLYLAKNRELNDENFPKIVCSFALILYKLGLNFSKTDERSTGEKYLLNCLEILKNCDLNFDDNLPQITPYLINIYLSAQNYLAVIYAARSEDEKCLEILNQAKIAYHKFKTEFSDSYPRDPIDCLKYCCGLKSGDEFKEECWLKFERLYTYTLFYMVQIYKNLNEFQKSALFCHETLVRQLNYNNYDPLEWSLNSATLSQYYINNNEAVNFAISRQCLASSLAMLDKFPVSQENDSNRKEKYQQCKADIFRCFAKYGLVLLEKSCDLYLDENPEENKIKILDKMDEEEAIMFDKLDYRQYLDLIGYRLAWNFESAKGIFMAVQSFLNKAKIFYQLNGWTSDYIEIIQDYSKAYKLLAIFEVDIDRKCQMHKRRLDLLNTLIKELNPVHYLNQCRQIYMDLAEISVEILDLKYEKLEQEKPDVPDAHKISKINFLAQQAIKFYQLFLESYKDREEKFPEKFDRDQIRPIVVAKLATGRLYNKQLTNDRNKKLEFCSLAHECFKWIVNYCKNVDNKSNIDLIENEYDVCKDMMRLYSVKIDRLKSLPNYRCNLSENL